MEINIAGYSVIVDESDVDKILQAGPWHIGQRELKRGLFYFYHTVVGSRKGSKIALHRFLIGAENRAVVDHINRNTLDNRKQNLRVVDYTTNNFNRTYKNIKFPGVSINKRNINRQYRARITVGERRINLGSFTTPEEAARAYKDAKKKYYGL